MKSLYLCMKCTWFKTIEHDVDSMYMFCAVKDNTECLVTMLGFTHCPQFEYSEVLSK